MQNKKELFENISVIAAYILIVVLAALYQLLQMVIIEGSFDISNYIYRVIFNDILIFSIFSIGFPDGKRDALKQADFQKIATSYRAKIDEINKKGENYNFRKHCDIFNQNQVYDAIFEILVLKLGLEMSWLIMSKNELKSKKKNKEINMYQYRQIRKCQRLKIKVPQIDANRVLIGSLAKSKVSFNYNELKETIKIILTKFITIALMTSVLAFNLESSQIVVDTTTIFNVVGSLLTALMAILFARKSGYTIIEKRKSTFLRWSDFIDDYNAKPLTENNLKVLPK